MSKKVHLFFGWAYVALAVAGVLVASKFPTALAWLFVGIFALKAAQNFLAVKEGSDE